MSGKYKIKKHFIIRYIITIPFFLCPFWTLLLITEFIATGVVSTFLAYYLSCLIDLSLKAVTQGVMFREAAYVLLPFVFLTMWSRLSWNLEDIIISRVQFDIRLKIREIIIDKRARLKYKLIEDTETWNLITRISDEPEEKIMDSLFDLLRLIKFGVRVTGILLLLFVHVWWIAVLIVLFTIPMCFLAIKSGKSSFAAEKNTSKSKRKYEYLSQLLGGRNSVSEKVLFGYGEKVNDMYIDEYRSVSRLINTTKIRWMIRAKSGTTLFAVTSILNALFLLPSTLAGTVSIGLFISLTNAASSMINDIAGLVGGCVNHISSRCEELRDLSDFLELEEEQNRATGFMPYNNEFQKIEFKNVTFQYPNTKKDVLKNLNLTFEKGLHYAMVGINGAGKTTIIKLLAGLYDDYQGQILFNGRDVKELTQEERRSMLSIAFQDFYKYELTLKENFLFGKEDLDNRLPSVLKNLELEQLAARLPEGLDTVLGKLEQDCADLSGGEWQRVALARALMNPAPFCILDEPTSAMDPLQESQLYTKFSEIYKDKTTLFISHRLGSTLLADLIYVIEDGKVIESGNHKKLMEQNGKYSVMYNSQKEWFR